MLKFISGLIIGLVLTALVFWRLFRRLTKGYERQKKSLLERARRAEKKAELSDLTGNLAHEIRNPLSIIKVNMQLLIEQVEYMLKDARTENGIDLSRIDDPERKLKRQLRKLETVMGEADRLANTLNDFLSFAGKIELHPVRQDINELITDLIDFYEPQAYENKVQLRVSLSTGPLFCRIDPDHIKQAILNLLINAVQAMTNGGGELMIQSRTMDNMIQINITDTGPGIPADIQDKIFNPYFTTRSGGTGLGLPTCRRIIEAHNGHIDIFSEPGKGTRFTIVLPLLLE